MEVANVRERILKQYVQIYIRTIHIINIKKFMPQLIPFYFMNQLSFAIFGLFLLVYLTSKYILPYFPYAQLIRIFITKLSNHD